MLRKITVALAGALFLSPATIPASFAQTPPPAASQSTAPDVADIGSGTRRAFAVAYIDVSRVAQANQERLAEAENPAEQQKVMQGINAQMVQIIDETPGISPNEYSAIAQAVQDDPELAQELRGYIQELLVPATE